MKKLLGKLVATTLALALILGLTVPVQANTVVTHLVDYGHISFEMPELPTSFDFATEFTLGLSLSGNVPADVIEMVNLFDGFTIRESGTVYTSGLSMSMFREVELSLEQILAAIPVEQVMPMMALLNLDLNEPFRIWVEIDINDLENPTFIMVIEMPAVVRLPFALLGTEFTRQFWVLDLSDTIAELAAELEAEIRQVTPEEFEEMLSYITEAIEQFFAYIEYYMEEIEELLAEAWEYLQEILTINIFTFGHNALENGHSAYLNLDATINYEGVIANISFDFYGEITNLNTATRPTLPELTAQNSFNLTNLLTGNW